MAVREEGDGDASGDLVFRHQDNGEATCDHRKHPVSYNRKLDVSLVPENITIPEEDDQKPNTSEQLDRKSNVLDILEAEIEFACTNSRTCRA